MFELSESQLFSLIKCNQCSMITNEPKVMPCGVNICVKCIQNNNNQQIKCKICKINHSTEHLFPNNSARELYNLYQVKTHRQNKQEGENVYDFVNNECEKVSLFESTKALIEQEYKSAIDQINASVSQLIEEILSQRDKLITEIETTKRENLVNLDEKFYLKINQAEQNNKNKLVNFDPAKNKISIKLLGEINYGTYKINLLCKLKNLNDKSFRIEADLSTLVGYENVYKKKFGILDKNKIYVLFERYFGNVNSLNMKIIYLDGTIMHSNQINGTWSFHSHCTHDKFLILAFRTKTTLYHIDLFNDKLDLLKSFSFHLELHSLFMDDKYIYLIASNSKYIIYMYDYDFNLVDSLGQTKYRHKPFYINGQILAINSDKIYAKNEKNLSIISKLNGIVMEQFDFEFDQIYPDLNYEDRLLIYKKYNELYIVNQKGKILQKNNLESDNLIQYDEFQLTKSGHFGFSCSKTNKILII